MRHSARGAAANGVGNRLMAEQDEGQLQESFSIGERLRLAREAKGLTLDEVASQTRIPIRHLQHIEREEWDALPAVTYAIGFARNYANIVGLDGAEVAGELRDRIGGPRARPPAMEYYEPADPARVPPRSLAIVAAILLAVLVAAYLIWRATLGGDDVPDLATAPPAAAPSTALPRPARPQLAAGQPVTLTATGEVWLRIDDAAAGGAPLYLGSLAPGDRYQVPATAQRPVIRTGRPQNLRISLGARDIGPLEPVERVVENVSLRAEDLAARGQGTSPGEPLSGPPSR